MSTRARNTTDRKIRTWGALLVVMCVALMTVQISSGTDPAAAAEPDIGPFPGKCPIGTVSPYPPIHAFCVRQSEYAEVSIDESALGDGGTVILTLTLLAPECTPALTVTPCVDSIMWGFGQTFGSMAYRLVTQTQTFLKDQFSYYQPFSMLSASFGSCIGGNPRPSSAPTCAVTIKHLPGLGALPPSYAVLMPAISVVLAPSDPLAHRKTEFIEAAFQLITQPVPNAPPIADFSFERTAATSFTFDADDSDDTDGTIDDYAWNYGDGQPIEHFPTFTTHHTYLEAGSYPVTLTVTDNKGATASVTKTVETAGTELIVNSTEDTGDDNLDDHICSTGVDLTGGDPECTLRAAMETAVLAAGTTPKITFAIDGAGVPSIAPATLLPAMTRAVEIDGTTQSGGYVEINGGSLPGRGLDLVGPSLVRGLVINRFNGAAIRLSGSGGSVVAGNRLGTDVTGMTALGNYFGVEIDNSPNNTIGGTATADANLISGNKPTVEVSAAGGIAIKNGATGNKVIGNDIGLAADGSVLLNSAGVGILNSNGNTVGGSGSEANRIAGVYGVVLVDANNNTIAGNQIGLDESGTTSFDEAFVGVLALRSSSQNTIRDNVVAGFVINVDAYGGAASGNQIIHNQIGLAAGGGAIPTAMGCQGNLYGIRVEGAPGTTIDGNRVAGHKWDVMAVGYTQLAIDKKPDGSVCVQIGGPGASAGGSPVTGRDITVSNNHIGLTTSGGVPTGVASQFGLGVYGGADAVTAIGNTIAGHSDSDLRVWDGTGHTLRHNTVVALPDHVTGSALNGIEIDAATTVAVESNVIAGHDKIELSIAGGSGVIVRGNRIGSANGEPGRAEVGIDIGAVTNTTIGGSQAGDANTVGFASVNGIRVGSRAVATSILGNNVGTDPTGNSAWPNAAGISVIAGAIDVRIDHNVVSGNTGPGIDLLGSARLTSNRIGQRNAGGALPNDVGVHIQNVPATLTSNTIVHNLTRGVLIDGASPVTITNGSIHSNGDKQGIAYSGAAPVSAPKMVGAMRTRPEDGVVGVLFVVASPGLAAGTIEVFGNTDCSDPEGRVPLLEKAVVAGKPFAETMKADEFSVFGTVGGVTATYTNAAGNTSVFSSCVEVATPQDGDLDGVLDLFEKSGPNDGDANHDSVPDFEQAGVTTLKTDGGYITLVAPSGTTLQNVGERDLAVFDLTPDVQLTYGLIGFDVQGLEPGAVAIVDMLTPVVPAEGEGYAKVVLGADGKWYLGKVSGVEAKPNGEGAERTSTGWRLHFADGGKFDIDATTNGRLRDPGGPAVFPPEAPPTTTPTTTPPTPPVVPSGTPDPGSAGPATPGATLPRTGVGAMPVRHAALLVIAGGMLIAVAHRSRPRGAKR